MSTELHARPMLGVLARREMRGYATSPLFLAGLMLAAVVLVLGFVDDDGTSSTMAMIAPAALIGLLGMVVMAGLAKRSDRAAAAAGTVSLGERDRTLALAAAAVVPFLAGLAWFAVAVVQYVLQPTEPFAVPFGGVGDAHVLAVMFALTVPACVGGPILGLVVARWFPQRGATVVGVVVLVLVTILMQGNFESTWRWHVVWPWTYWYGPLGWSNTGGGSSHWVALPGSPYAWIGYLAALCVSGVVVALHHDPESDRPRLRRRLVAAVLVAVLALVLTLTLGLDRAITNPVPGPAF